MEETTVRIEQLKPGDLFRIGKSVYVRDAYNRSTKRYEAHRYDDVCAFREFKKGKIVNTELED